MSALSALLVLAFASPAGAFKAGAASVDVTPPPYTSESDSAFVPACGTSAAQVAQLWPGPRDFAFEKPYVDAQGVGHYEPGDPYCESDGTGRYEAPYIAGGSGAEPLADGCRSRQRPAGARDRASTGTSKVAIVSVDSIGLFDVTMQRIRERGGRTLDPSIEQVFVSSTHDESAPDPIGLWGPEPGITPRRSWKRRRAPAAASTSTT